MPTKLLADSLPPIYLTKEPTLFIFKNF